MLLQFIDVRYKFKHLILILMTAILFLLGQAFTPCKNSAYAQSLYSSISTQDLNEMINRNENFNLVDLRSIQEYLAGHIPGAISIPYRQLSYRYRELNPKIKTVLYCRVGQTCYPAAQLLVSFGFTNLYTMSGGFLAWEYAIELEGIKII